MEVRKTDANEAGVVEHLPVYSDWLNGIASRYRQSPIKAAISVNAEMLKFYWSLGADIIRMEKDQPWGSKFMQRLSTDLKVSMPDALCFSKTNLKYIRRFFLLYCPRSIGQQVADQNQRASVGTIGQQLADQLGVAHQGIAQIVQQDAEQLLLTEFVKGYPKVSELIFSVPWGHHMVIIDKFGNDQDAALFYVHKTVENGWSLSHLLFRSEFPTMSLNISFPQTSSRSCPRWKKWRANLRAEWKSPSATWAACWPMERAWAWRWEKGEKLQNRDGNLKQKGKQ